MVNQRSHTSLVPLSLFLGCVREFGCLEELTILRYFLPVPPQMRPRGRLLLTSRIYYVEIEDYPHNISHILSALTLPANADVLLRGSLGGTSIEKCATSLAAMLPADASSLPILRDVSSVTVKCVPGSCSIWARTAGLPNCGRLGLTTAMKDSIIAESWGKPLNGMLLALKDIFPLKAPIERLKCIGALDDVSSDTWFATLDQLPLLRVLELDLDEFAAGRSASALLSVLGSQSRRVPKRVVCPALENLQLYADYPATGLVEDLRRCATERKELGCRTTLGQLKLGLCSDAPGPSREDEERITGSFLQNGLADKVIVEILLPGDDEQPPIIEFC
ncbi:hypothetical protein C8Q77DRAFT_500069 [Trametes polyzona]|nr:hypothetical protein C8Q77DRAFT_500069 [Trametes polyzona]